MPTDQHKHMAQQPIHSHNQKPTDKPNMLTDMDAYKECTRTPNINTNRHPKVSAGDGEGGALSEGPITKFFKIVLAVYLSK
jgi:hypothetical protein